MAHWRMQLHPDRIDQGANRTAESLERGYIGLDFRKDVGDLRGPHGEIEKGQRPYRLFQSEMKVGDLVLVQIGFQPFALVEVTGEYEYLPQESDRRVWFRHMRRVSNVRLYRDFVRSGEPCERLPFRSTLMPIRDMRQSAAHLIERWANAA